MKLLYSFQRAFKIWSGDVLLILPLSGNTSRKKYLRLAEALHTYRVQKGGPSTIEEAYGKLSRPYGAAKITNVRVYSQEGHDDVYIVSSEYTARLPQNKLKVIGLEGSKT